MTRDTLNNEQANRYEWTAEDSDRICSSPTAEEEAQMAAERERSGEMPCTDPFADGEEEALVWKQNSPGVHVAVSPTGTIYRVYLAGTDGIPGSEIWGASAGTVRFCKNGPHSALLSWPTADDAKAACERHFELSRNP